MLHSTPIVLASSEDNCGLLLLDTSLALFMTLLHGDASGWGKPLIDIQTTVLFWPGLTWPSQAKMELLL